MKYVELFENFKKVKKSKKLHELSGIVLIVDNRILMVKATKYSDYDDKWSIPKGHIEGNSLDSAIKELYEESGIKIDTNYDVMFDIQYVKSGVIKIMDVYVYHRDKSEFENYLDGWEISSDFLHVEEITEAEFFTPSEAIQRIDISMIDILDIVEF